ATQSAISELMARMQTAPPSLRTADPSIPDTLAQLVTRCIEPEPSARYQTSSELAADLSLIDDQGQLLPGVTQNVRTWQGTSTAPLPQPVTLPRQSLLSPKWIAAALVVLALGAAGIAFRDRILRSSTRSPSASATSISLAVLPFQNATGDQTLDWLGASLSDMIKTELGRSSHVRTVSSDRLHQVMRDLRISSNSRLDRPTVRRLAEFSSAEQLISGQYSRLGGNRIRIDAVVHNLKREEPVSVGVEAASEQELLQAVTRLGQAIQENLALAPSLVRELRATPAEPSSKSIHALRFFSEGLQLGRQGNHLEALKRFEASTQEDPEFALAYAKLGQTYATIGYDNEAEQSSR
ncbi:MAG: hypothetical protein ACRD1T_24595, partial [Acidimicrobiia bacterium]